jgi:hypothetical protein
MPWLFVWVLKLMAKSRFCLFINKFIVQIFRFAIRRYHELKAREDSFLFKISKSLF